MRYVQFSVFPPSWEPVSSLNFGVAMAHEVMMFYGHCFAIGNEQPFYFAVSSLQRRPFFSTKAFVSSISCFIFSLAFFFPMS